MKCCKVLKFCEKCDCEKTDGLAAAIAQPQIEQSGLVREVPQLRDDCLCQSQCDCNTPTPTPTNPHKNNTANEWVEVVDLANQQLGFLDKDGI